MSKDFDTYLFWLIYTVLYSHKMINTFAYSEILDRVSNQFSLEYIYVLKPSMYETRIAYTKYCSRPKFLSIYWHLYWRLHYHPQLLLSFILRHTVISSSITAKQYSIANNPWCSLKEKKNQYMVNHFWKLTSFLLFNMFVCIYIVYEREHSHDYILYILYK